jgi:hypothetical protein
MQQSSTIHHYTFTIAGYEYGFVDDQYEGFGGTWTQGWIELGPLGGYKVPFSATVGWAIVILTPLVLVMLVATLYRRRKKPS